MTGTFWAIVVGIAMSLAGVTQAHALNTRTWISSTGVDQAGCGPIANPCRTLQYAHDQTAPDGEIDVKDSAGYGPLAIAKAITVFSDGNIAGVLSQGSGDGITIAAGTGVVTLVGLTIEGADTGRYGIRVESAGKLTIAKCTIQKFTGSGISIAPASSVAIGATIEDVLLTGNGYGVAYVPANGQTVTRIFLHRVTISDNYYHGLFVRPYGSGSVYLVASDVSIYGHPQPGALIDGSYGTVNVYADFDNVGFLYNNQSTMDSGAGLVVTKAIASLNRTVFTGNNRRAVSILNGASVTTYGNNKIGYSEGTLTPANLE